MGTFILASLPLCAIAAEPPLNLAKLVAERELACEKVRANYTYRQVVTIQESDPQKGGSGGAYRETRDIIFSPAGERSEALLSPPSSTLKRLLLTPEDFSDIRDIQPMLIVPEILPRYITRYRGEEDVDGIATWVLEVTPKQVFHGFRMFDGMVWVNQRDMSIVRIHGQAVPSIHTATKENLFPMFTTLREKVDGNCWFPTITWADDVLAFRNGAVRMKLQIRYLNYKRFSADSVITFETAPDEKKPQP